MKIDHRSKLGKKISLAHARNRRFPTISCHFCGNKWDPKNRCFVCPKCHTVYNPQKNPLVAFAGELKVARQRENMSQRELAEGLGIKQRQISDIEQGVSTLTHAKTKILREKLRIFIESTKSPIDRRNEINQMFNSGQKEPQNG